MLSRKLWIGAVSGLLLMGVAWVGGATSGRVEVANAAPLDAPPAGVAQQPIAAKGVFMWNYSVKFVCGVQDPLTTANGQQALGEPPVKPGNYATEINIHNYVYREVKVRKKLLVMVDKGEALAREPKSVQPTKLDGIVLPPDGATLDDCNRLWELAGGVPPAPAPLMIGYLVVLSPVDLDIDAVYTAEVSARVGATDVAQPMGIALDVVRVPGKRVFVPNTVLALFP